MPWEKITTKSVRINFYLKWLLKMGGLQRQNNIELGVIVIQNNTPIRLGMVGGGQGAFIGGIHRLATQLDGQYQLVAGALSSTPEKSIASGLALGIDETRCYPDFKTMAKIESKRPDAIEAVVIVTPNFMHSEPIKTFLEVNINVFCDKPITATLAEAESLKSIIENSDAHFVITYNYSANALIRQARQMVLNGDLGDIRVIQGEYAQGWLAQPQPYDNKQAVWRTDPKKAGSGVIGDIGSHAFQLMNYVSGLTATKLYANLSSFVENRLVDDDAQILLEYEKGVKGMLWASQIAEGCENRLKLEIYGTKGGIGWEQEIPNQMWYSSTGKPKQLLTRAGTGSLEDNKIITRTPRGHPEGYLEAFANIYKDMAIVIQEQRNGQKMAIPSHIPKYTDGLRGMQFIDACQRSNIKKTWVKLGK